MSAPSAADRRAVYRALDLTFADFVRAHDVPGLVFGVVAEGRLDHVAALGVADLSSQRPVTPDTSFRIASMTKLFTALGVLQLRDRGLLALDNRIDVLVPELHSLRYPAGDSAPVRVRDLLMHTAGFPGDDAWADRQLGMSEEAFSALLESGMAFANPPGTAHEYSNTGYAILGRAVRHCAGRPFTQYIGDNILAPLGMNASGWCETDRPSDRAVGHSRSAGHWRQEEPQGRGPFSAMGGLHTTARDYAKFVTWLLSAWPARDGGEGTILARSSIREIAHGGGFPQLRVRPLPVRANDGGAAMTYGLGTWVAMDGELGTYLTHSGGLPGYGSNVLMLPAHGAAVFAFANLTYAPAEVPVRDAALALHRSGVLAPPPHPPSPGLLAARDAVLAIYRAADVRAAAGFLADNVLLDRGSGQRNRELEALRAALGDCGGEVSVRAENATSGRFVFRCEHGRLGVRIALTPVFPLRIQELEFQAESSGAPMQTPARSPGLEYRGRAH